MVMGSQRKSLGVILADRISYVEISKLGSVNKIAIVNGRLAIVLILTWRKLKTLCRIVHYEPREKYGLFCGKSGKLKPERNERF